MSLKVIEPQKVPLSKFRTIPHFQNMFSTSSRFLHIKLNVTQQHLRLWAIYVVTGSMLFAMIECLFINIVPQKSWVLW